MIKNIIFDYNGVLASINPKKLLKKFNLADKFKVHRMITGYRKNKEIKSVLNLYKSGKIGRTLLHNNIKKIYPKSSYVFSKILRSLSDCIDENQELLNLIEKLHNEGVKIIMLSNSIPEIEAIIQNSPLVKNFDGFVLSHKVEMLKPDRDIYDFTCKFYDLVPSETLFVDDSEENVESARRFGLKSMHCDNIKTITGRVSSIFFSNKVYDIQRNSDCNNDEKFDNNKSRD